MSFIIGSAEHNAWCTCHGTVHVMVKRFEDEKINQALNLTSATPPIQMILSYFQEQANCIFQTLSNHSFIINHHHVKIKRAYLKITWRQKQNDVVL